VNINTNKDTQTPMNTAPKKRFLIALPCFPNDTKSWNHQTILVSAKDRDDAIALAKHLRPDCRHIGRVEQVNY